MKDKIAKLSYVMHLISFTASKNRIFYFSIVISVISVCIEVLAMSSIIPLFAVISGSKLTDTGFVAKSIIQLGFSVNARNILSLFFITLTLRVITQSISQTVILKLGKTVMAQLCTEAFEAVITQSSIKQINEKSIGYYTNLAGDESSRASSLVISVMQFIPTLLLSGLYFFAIVHYSIVFAFVLIIFILICCFFLYFLGKLSHRLGVAQLSQGRLTGSLFLDGLNNLKTVRLFNAEKYIIKKHRTEMFKYTNLLFWTDEVSVLTRYIPILFLLIVFGCIFFYSAQTIDSIGIDFVVAMIAYLTRFLPTLGHGVSLLLRIAADAASGKDVTELIRFRQVHSQNQTKHIDTISEIQVNGLYFSYQQTKEKNILTGFTYDFRKGNSYALTGGSGIGKSTFAEILLKCYLPDRGSITINDISYLEIGDAELREKIVLLGQEDAIFDDTVWNNICLGYPATVGEVRAACDLVCLSEVVDKMPNGFESRLHYQGANLSGGQRQRIALARALLKKPKALILDESTNAIDDATKTQILTNIKLEYRDKILIFITHDTDVINIVDHCVDILKESN